MRHGSPALYPMIITMKIAIVFFGIHSFCFAICLPSFIPIFCLSYLDYHFVFCFLLLSSGFHLQASIFRLPSFIFLCSVFHLLPSSTVCCLQSPSVIHISSSV